MTSIRDMEMSDASESRGGDFGEGRLSDLEGQIFDIDSHELIPRCMWHDHFGETGRLFAPLHERLLDHGAPGPNSAGFDVHGDETPIDHDSVWKGRPRVLAPGVVDLRRRPEVLDFMGIRRQLIFPGFGLCAIFARKRSLDEVVSCLNFEGEGFSTDDFSFDRLEERAEVAHNEWAIGYADLADRVRPVGLVTGRSVSKVMEVAEYLIDAGIRAIWLPSSRPPGGMSPSHPDLDPFWRLCADANVAVLNHLGGDFGFYDAPPWREGVELFDGALTLETTLDPYSFATSAIAPSHFVLTMVLGGVFERHPNLRFGVIESGANWVGPLSEYLDLWAERSSRMRSNFSLKPSEYISRNVRVTPFTFEPIGRYIERYGLEDVYCFSTDYPHVEGGSSPKEDFAQTLAPLGASSMRKFFVENGRFLMPD